jgi:hypothetical protein
MGRLVEDLLMLAQFDLDRPGAAAPDRGNHVSTNSAPCVWSVQLGQADVIAQSL